jgi:cation/acetate symporter
MANRLTEAERQARGAIDGWVAFATAAVAMAAGLLVLLDRIGLPEQGAKWLAILVVAGTLALIGLLLRAARISTFYVAGRAVPASWSGLALAGTLAGMGLIFLPPLPIGVSGRAVLAGFATGIVGLALLTGPLIRKSGAFSVTDLLSMRFPDLPARLSIVALAAAICALAALAGLSEAVRLLRVQMQLSPGLAVWLSSVVLLLMVLPGGLRGLTWGAAAAGGLLLAALAAPILLLAGQDIALPAPWIGEPEAWAHAAERLGSWGGLAAGGPDWLAVPLAIGLMAFAPLLTLSATARDRVGAHLSVAAGTVWLLLIGFAAVMTLALGAIGLDVTLIGQRPDRLADVWHRASADGFISICGQHVGGPAQARAACAGAPGFAGVLRAGDVSATLDFLTFGLADTQGLGGAWRAMTLAGWYGACLALAAAGLQGLATAIGHDLVYRLHDRTAITSRRLATTRLALLAATVLVCLTVLRFSPDPRLLLAFSLTLCAAGIAPLLLLSLWPRARSLEAEKAIATGLGVAIVAADIMRAYGGPMAEATGAGALAGAAAALVAGVYTGLRREADPADPADGMAFRSRLMRAGAEALPPDRGA